MNPRISIAMATYQGETYFKQQLESLIHQTMTPHEIIIYDDASTDKTLSIAHEYENKNDIVVKVFQQPIRVGYIKNFASALKQTTGDYIFLCDQDDVWVLDKIETMMKLFQKHPQISCINTSAYLMDAHGQISPKELVTRGEGYVELEDIFYHNSSMGCTMAFTKAVKERYLNDSLFQAPHDWELNMIAAMERKLYYLATPLIYYRLHDRNTTGNDAFQKANHLFSDSREKNAATMRDFIQGCVVYCEEMQKTQKEKLHHLRDFYEHRYTLLHERKSFHWFYLMKHWFIYRKVVSYKGMMVDFVYSFKPRRKE